jgi:hypothetical protein
MGVFKNNSNKKSDMPCQRHSQGGRQYSRRKPNSNRDTNQMLLSARRLYTAVFVQAYKDIRRIILKKSKSLTEDDIWIVNFWASGDWRSVADFIGVAYLTPKIEKQIKSDFGYGFTSLCHTHNNNRSQGLNHRRLYE